MSSFQIALGFSTLLYHKKSHDNKIHKIVMQVMGFAPRALKASILLPSSCSLLKEADRPKCQLTKAGHINIVGCQPLPFEGLETHTLAFMHLPRHELWKAPTLPRAPPSIMFMPAQGGGKTQTEGKSLGTVCLHARVSVGD